MVLNVRYYREKACGGLLNVDAALERACVRPVRERIRGDERVYYPLGVRCGCCRCVSCVTNLAFIQHISALPRRRDGSASPEGCFRVLLSLLAEVVTHSAHPPLPLLVLLSNIQSTYLPFCFRRRCEQCCTGL